MEVFKVGIDLRDVAILANLYDGSHLNRVSGMLIKDFNLDRQYSTLYKRLNRLESLGYISRGFQIAQSNTYFITEAGIKFYEEAIV
jgi:DNA-binding MarR family transcriptional regulator